ncbi:MAG: hypothetical protein ACLQNE_28690 [Thermoguttaceae bacterium]
MFAFLDIGTALTLSFIEFLYQFCPSPFEGNQASFQLPGFLADVGPTLRSSCAVGREVRDHQP